MKKSMFILINIFTISNANIEINLMQMADALNALNALEKSLSIKPPIKQKKAESKSSALLQEYIPLFIQSVVQKTKKQIEDINEKNDPNFTNKAEQTINKTAAIEGNLAQLIFTITTSKQEAGKLLLQFTTMLDTFAQTIPTNPQEAKKQLEQDANKMINTIKEAIDTTQEKNLLFRIKKYIGQQMGQELINAIQEHNKEKALDLLKVADINYKLQPKTISKDGKQLTVGLTPLLASIQAGTDEVTKALLEKNVDVNAQDRGGTTALMYAAAQNRPEIVKKLTSKNADASIQDNEGNTALIKALRRYPINKSDFLKKGNKKEFNSMFNSIVKDLLIANGNINAQGTGGVTALMLAAGYGMQELVENLLSKDARTDLKDMLGQTAYDHAEKFPAIQNMIKQK